MVQTLIWTSHHLFRTYVCICVVRPQTHRQWIKLGHIDQRNPGAVGGGAYGEGHVDVAHGGDTRRACPRCSVRRWRSPQCRCSTLETVWGPRRQCRASITSTQGVALAVRGAVRSITATRPATTTS
jgi:hypothetical protein